MSYKIYMEDANYSDWIIIDQKTMQQASVNINPLEKKLLTGDTIDEDGNILDSIIRKQSYLAGILVLKGKTYGRSKSGNGKFYYKCIPNDKRLPAFLIPFENKDIGFSKVILNKYILFRFNNWDAKHPYGTIVNTIGNVSDLNAFYDYQLYCKDLVKPLKTFTSAANQANRRIGKDMYSNLLKFNIEDRRDRYIISVDPEKSTDLDDAIGITDNILSIYIANVPLLLEYLQLWGSFSERISTIYLPDRKCPMLPVLLSENLCSLLQNEDRLAFCIDITISDNIIIKKTIKNVIINVKENYTYDSERLLNNSTYKEILNIAIGLNKNYKYIREINDSHHVIAYLMLLMNVSCAELLQKFNCGIYRSVKLQESNKPISQDIPNDVYNTIKLWQTSSGQYTTLKDNIGHQLINKGLDTYIHITSPIRRLVDLLNMIKLIEKVETINLSKQCLDFYDHWENKLEYINTTMRSIRKVQTDCSMLHLCIHNKDVLDCIYTGYIFDMIAKHNNLNQYTVYIPDIKMFTRVNIKTILANFTCHKFKLYLIQDGITLKQKIRAELI